SNGEPSHRGTSDQERESPGDQSRREKKDEAPEQPPEPSRKQRVRNYLQTHRQQMAIGAILVVALLILTIFLLIYLDSYESTDDAQVDGHLNAISARISGTIAGVYVDNNQYVKEGQICVDLDPNDYKVGRDQANASYAQAAAQLRAENPNVPITLTTNLTTISSTSADVFASQAAVIAAQQDYQARLAAVRQ